MRQSRHATDLYGEDTEFDEAEDYEYGSDEAQAFEAAEELDETEEMELASQLLEMTDEGELDQFLGSLIKRAGRAAGHFARSGAGRALGGILKGAAKKALPHLGGAIGGYLGGPAGSQIGSQLAANAGSLFGLELEGLSEEDQEFEVARRLVRFSDAAAKNLASAPSSGSPQQAASAAALAAASRHAPGMIRAAGPGHSSACPNCGGKGSDGQGCPSCGKAMSGRWIRRGPHIIIVNAHASGPSRNKSRG
jgi:hypothetical protein